jgi:hypothetical protein
MYRTILGFDTSALKMPYTGADRTFRLSSLDLIPATPSA